MSSLRDFIRVASGKGKADLLIKNGRVVNVFSGQIERTDVAIWKGLIVGFGDYEAKTAIDVEGDFLCSGLIDGHVHIESSMVTIPEFARAVVPHGTTTVVTDPHEIANVLGSNGVRFMAESARGVPLNLFFMIPSCVPATHLETSGAVLGATEIKTLLQRTLGPGPGRDDEFPGSPLRRPGRAKKNRCCKREKDRWPRSPSLRKRFERLPGCGSSIGP